MKRKRKEKRLREGERRDEREVGVGKDCWETG